MSRLIWILILARLADSCMRRAVPLELVCPPDITAIASPRLTSAHVTWKRQDFTIRATNPLLGIYQQWPENGAAATFSRDFPEGEHLISYKVVDDTGQFASCNFRVRVQVSRCPPLFRPSLGGVRCDADNVLGSRCMVECVHGHVATPVASTECLATGRWTHHHIVCRAQACADPGTPAHGSRHCTSPSHVYGSLCHFDCNQGYVLEGSRVAICQIVNGQSAWTANAPICRELRRPLVERCPDSLHFTSGSSTRTVARPNVSFRTAAGEEAPFYCSHFGTSTTYSFTLGSHAVTCTGYDPKYPNLASSTCSFAVEIEPNPCSPLPQPVHGLLLCSSGSALGPLHDTTCRLFCHLGYHLPRDQTANANFWCDNHGNWRPSPYVPSCVEMKRPKELKLSAEIHYRSSNCTSTVTQRAISKHFRVFSESTIRKEPNCAKMPGDCIIDQVNTSCVPPPEAASILRHAQYKQRQIQTDSADSTNVALSSDTDVMSGPTSDQQTMNYLLIVRFELATRSSETRGDWSLEYHTAIVRLHDMFNHLETQINEGQFSIADKTQTLQIEEVLNSLAMEAFFTTVCDNGYKFDHRSLLCVPCGAGTYFDSSSGVCERCPIGSYRSSDGGVGPASCTQCARGMITLDKGAVNISQCEDIDECESSPCQHNSICQNLQNSYSCLCQTGFTGRNCEELLHDCSAHSCLHGATCQALSSSQYACVCPPLYSGDFCQFVSNDGGWSSWTGWSQCSQSCLGGQQTRTRSCNSPSPSLGGKQCQGHDKETRTCNTHQCPSCQKLRRPYGGYITCQSFPVHEVLVCKINCPPGYSFSTPVLPAYSCGRNTSFLWPHESPVNPRAVLPSCTPSSVPQREELQIDVALNESCTPEVQQMVRELVRNKSHDLARDLECIRTGECQLNIPHVSQCIKQRSKRSLEEEEKDVVTLSLTLSYEPIRKQHTKDAVLLGEFSQLLANIADLDTDNVHVDTQHISASYITTCTAGSVAVARDLCVQCAPGSFYEPARSVCVLCEQGYYQPFDGQKFCMTCPNDRTTLHRGTVASADCIGSVNSLQALPEPQQQQQEMITKHGAVSPIAVCVPVIGLILLILLLALFLYKQRKRRWKKKDDAEYSRNPQIDLTHSNTA